VASAISSRARLIFWIVAILAFVTVVLFITRAVIQPNLSNPVERVEYSQYTSTPDYDNSIYTVTNGVRIAKFQALVKKYSVDIADFNNALNDGCTGGLATNVTLYRAGNAMQKLNLYSCRGPNASGTFVADATKLFSEWHAKDQPK
jgi:hypothetical protein